LATERHAGLGGGDLWADCRETAGRFAPDVLAEHLRDVLALAQRLTSVESLEVKLAGNAREDPVPSVRVANLRTLLEHYPEHPATHAALQAALTDGDEEVQVVAAIASGALGRPVLLEMVAREWTGDACAARAVRELRSHLPAEAACAALSHALRTRRVQTAHACLESLGHRGSRSVPAIARVLAVEHGELADAAAHALGMTNAHAAEKPLLDALMRDTSIARIASAEALGRVGSAAAVPLLKDAEARHPSDVALRRACRQAVAAIQSRLSGASPGQVSLVASAAGPESGQLSLPDPAEGRVSLAPKKRK
jgi:HEAT repeat protein